MADWVLYGANGYTGELIAREAHRRSLHPILAGRNEQRISRLAAELGSPWRVFALSDTARITRALAGARLVLNCAGPFSATAVPMLEACLSAGVHYLDIAGEIDAIEVAAARNERAKRAGIVLISAVGFDVVPSDCLAAMLAAQLPSATRLQLAINGFSSLSPGTLKTMLESLPQGGRVRIDGHITRVPVAWKTRQVPFATGSKTAVIVPWGDVASAYYSTGIGNIEVYATIPPKQLRLLRQWSWLIPLLRWGPLRRAVEHRVVAGIRGPTAGDRAAGRGSFWGRVEDEAGKSVEATLTTRSGYDLTVLTALASVERVLTGDLPPGFHTPSSAFGRDFILAIPDTDYRIARIKPS